MVNIQCIGITESKLVNIQGIGITELKKSKHRMHMYFEINIEIAFTA